MSEGSIRMKMSGRHERKNEGREERKRREPGKDYKKAMIQERKQGLFYEMDI